MYYIQSGFFSLLKTLKRLLYTECVFLLMIRFLNSSYWRNFEDIDLIFLQIVEGWSFFSICNLWSFTHIFFLEIENLKKDQFYEKFTPV